ncbi:MAG: DUF4358 domain-containing protein [Oscillospiraceae bacterium]
MNIKKIIAAAAALALCASVLTACGSSADEEITTASETTTVSETEAETSEETESESESESETETETEAESEASDETAAEEDAEAASNPLQPIADAALAVGEWPVLMEVTDETALKEFFLLDPANENYRNMLVLQCPMSASMCEIIIIEADDVNAAKADLDARREKAINQDAWYPKDIELAEASIVGTEGDYAYFIFASEASEAEKSIVDAIKAL